MYQKDFFSLLHQETLAARLAQEIGDLACELAHKPALYVRVALLPQHISDWFPVRFYRQFRGAISEFYVHPVSFIVSALSPHSIGINGGQGLAPVLAGSLLAHALLVTLLISFVPSERVSDIRKAGGSHKRYKVVELAPLYYPPQMLGGSAIDEATGLSEVAERERKRRKRQKLEAERARREKSEKEIREKAAKQDAAEQTGAGSEAQDGEDPDAEVTAVSGSPDEAQNAAPMALKTPSIQTPEDVISSIIGRASENAADFRTYSFKSITHTRLAQGEKIIETKIESQFYMANQRVQSFSYERYWSEGRELSEAERLVYQDRVLGEIRRRNGRMSSFHSPYHPDFTGEYTYQLLGEEEVDGYICIQIGFQSRVEDRLHGHGTMWMDKKTMEVVKAVYSLAKNPPFVTTTRVEENRKEVLPGIWMEVSTRRSYSGSAAVITGSFEQQIVNSEFRISN